MRLTSQALSALTDENTKTTEKMEAKEEVPLQNPCGSVYWANPEDLRRRDEMIATWPVVISPTDVRICSMSENTINTSNVTCLVLLPYYKISAIHTTPSTTHKLLDRRFQNKTIVAVIERSTLSKDTRVI